MTTAEQLREEGRVEGEAKAHYKIAIELLGLVDTDKELISNVTGLTSDEVEQIAKLLDQTTNRYIEIIRKS